MWLVFSLLTKNERISKINMGNDGQINHIMYESDHYVVNKSIDHYNNPFYVFFGDV